MPKQSPSRGQSKAKAKHGGARVAGPGRRMGRPPKFDGVPMDMKRTVRIPRKWIEAIEAVYPTFTDGFRDILGKSEPIRAIDKSP